MHVRRAGLPHLRHHLPAQQGPLGGGGGGGGGAGGGGAADGRADDEVRGARAEAGEDVDAVAGGGVLCGREAVMPGGCAGQRRGAWDRAVEQGGLLHLRVRCANVPLDVFVEPAQTMQSHWSRTSMFKVLMAGTPDATESVKTLRGKLNEPRHFRQGNISVSHKGNVHIHIFVFILFHQPPKSA